MARPGPASTTPIYLAIAATLTACTAIRKAAIGPPWQSLTNGSQLGEFSPTRFGGEGPVEIVNGHIELGFGEPLTGITWLGAFPRDNYEVELEATRLDGTDFFCGLTFPVGPQSCSVILGGWGGSTTGLSCIDGQDASSNPTCRYLDYRDGQPYQLRLRVAAGRIQAWLDGQQIIDQVSTGHRIEIRPEVEPSLPFGIAAFATRAAIGQVRLRQW